MVLISVKNWNLDLTAVIRNKLYHRSFHVLLSPVRLLSNSHCITIIKFTSLGAKWLRSIAIIGSTWTWLRNRLTKVVIPSHVSESPFFSGMANMMPWLLSMCLLGLQEIAVHQPASNALSRDLGTISQRSVPSGFRSVRTLSLWCNLITYNYLL